MSEWHDRLKREVPRADIPPYLAELQALVAHIRRFRDDLRFPQVEDLEPYVTPLLSRHAGLTVDYIGDIRYREVVASALKAKGDDAG